METKKKLDITCINKIKYEEADEFENSIFSNVYYKAGSLVRRIIEENNELEDYPPDSEYCSDEQFNNIIAFLGGRGMGKSSALLSFALFLKKYEAREQKFINLNTEKIRPRFYTLPRIDVAMLIQGENILDIVLAKMWDAFERRNSNGMDFEELKESFRKVKKSYEVYWRTTEGRKDFYNRTSIRELHDLASCLNLRDDFKKLVYSYLEYMMRENPHRREADRFLVISIDDLDVAMGDIYGIMEQIRMFLMVPHVIVLLSADIERLSMSCNKEISEKMICDVITEREKKQIREYVTHYIAKILPGNMRVNMPDLNSVGGVEYEIQTGEGLLKIYSNGMPENICFNEKKMIFVLLAKYLNILFVPFRKKHHFLQKDSLRKIVNNLYILYNILQQAEKKQFYLACQWCYSELLEMVKNEDTDNVHVVMKQLMQSDEEHINQIITQLSNPLLSSWNEPPLKTLSWLTKAKEEPKLWENGETDYGNILSMIWKEEEHYQNLSDFSVLFYSILVRQAIEAGKKTESFCKQNIFTPILLLREENDKLKIEEKVNNSVIKPSILFDLVYDDEGKLDIIKILLAKKEEILNVFWSLNLYEGEVWKLLAGEGHSFKCLERSSDNAVDSSLDGKEEQTEQNSGQVDVLPINLENQMKAQKSLDNIFFNAVSYKEHLKGFLNNLYTSLYSYVTDKLEKTVAEQDITNIWENEYIGDNIKEYNKWKEDYGIRSVADILPLQSPDVMCYLAERLPLAKFISNQNDPNLKLDVIRDVIEVRLKFIVAELREIEEYYGYQNLGYQSYSERIEEYVKILCLSSLPDSIHQTWTISLEDEFSSTAELERLL